MLTRPQSHANVRNIGGLSGCGTASGEEGRWLLHPEVGQLVLHPQEGRPGELVLHPREGRPGELGVLVPYPQEGRPGDTGTPPSGGEACGAGGVLISNPQVYREQRGSGAPASGREASRNVGSTVKRELVKRQKSCEV